MIVPTARHPCALAQFEFVRGHRHAHDRRSALVRQLVISPPAGAEWTLADLIWDEEVLRSQLRLMMDRAGASAVDVVRAWDRSGDGTLSEAEFLANLQAFFPGGASVSELGAIWQREVRHVARIAFRTVASGGAGAGGIGGGGVAAAPSADGASTRASGSTHPTGPHDLDADDQLMTAAELEEWLSAAPSRCMPLKSAHGHARLGASESSLPGHNSLAGGADTAMPGSADGAGGSADGSAFTAPMEDILRRGTRTMRLRAELAHNRQLRALQRGRRPPQSRQSALAAQRGQERAHVQAALTGAVSHPALFGSFRHVPAHSGSFRHAPAWAEAGAVSGAHFQACGLGALAVPTRPSSAIALHRYRTPPLLVPHGDLATGGSAAGRTTIRPRTAPQWTASKAPPLGIPPAAARRRRAT